MHLVHPNQCQVTAAVVCVCEINSSYMILIGVHKMHGFVGIVDLRSSLAYFVMIHPLPVASKLPIKY